MTFWREGDKRIGIGERALSANQKKKMNAISITIDIEDWYHKTFLQAKSFTKKTFIEKWDGKYDYLSLRKPTRRVLDMLDEYDINATFFVVADVVEHYPGLVESIQSYL